MITDLFLTYYHSEILEEKSSLQTDVLHVKTYYDQIGKNVIHSADIGLRGYFIYRSPTIVQPLLNSLAWKDSIFNALETGLNQFHYRSPRYDAFKQSLTEYLAYCMELKALLDEQKDAEFVEQFAQDKGAELWYQYLLLEEDIFKFVNNIDQAAKKDFDASIRQMKILKIVLLVLSVPTLLLTAFFTSKSISYLQRLKAAEGEKNQWLEEQKVQLERKVAERTKELYDQNQEILAQREELTAQHDALAEQNEQLAQAKLTIEKQNKEIQFKNEFLETEVRHRTREIQETNRELMEYNSQVEQFAFVIAHNLRAPLARILGISQLFKYTQDEAERILLLDKLTISTNQLDLIVKDLNVIVGVKKQQENFVVVDLGDVMKKMRSVFQHELAVNQITVNINLISPTKIVGVLQYAESIVYHLISNAIKFRNFEVPGIINISTHVEGEFLKLSITDNGLGIDLSKFGNSLFKLYKRFHLHMEGRGVGLYLIKLQAESMGGRIEVFSEAGRGSTFNVYFRTTFSEV